MTPSDGRSASPKGAGVCGAQLARDDGDGADQAPKPQRAFGALRLKLGCAEVNHLSGQTGAHWPSGLSGHQIVVLSVNWLTHRFEADVKIFDPKGCAPRVRIALKINKGQVTCHGPVQKAARDCGTAWRSKEEKYALVGADQPRPNGPETLNLIRGQHTAFIRGVRRLPMRPNCRGGGIFLSVSLVIPPTNAPRYRHRPADRGFARSPTSHH